MSARQDLLAILFDMDGVLYAADEINGGAVETVAWVRAQRIPHLFLTNTTSTSRAALVDELLAFGIPAQEAEIFTPAAAAAKWLRTQAAADIALFVRPAARLEFAHLPCLPGAGRCISLDVAPFVVALEHATARQVLVFGKPASSFFAAAVEKLGLPAKRVLMIGDDIEADVAGAQAAGLKGALVRTGKFRSSDLEGSVRPDVVFDTIADLPEWWNGHCT